MASHEEIDRRSRDFLARPLSTIFWWGLPLLAGFSTNLLPVPAMAATFVWASAFAWMGVGCTLNARHCHRLHCCVSAPVLFLGAAAAIAAGLGLGPLGPGTAGHVIGATLLLALATFLVEPIWGKYRRR